MKLLYGTGNPAKFEAMERRLSGLGLSLIYLKDISLKIPKVVEDGKTPLENARKKGTRLLPSLWYARIFL